MANITKRGNSFYIRVSAGYDTKGKQIFKSTTYKPPVGMSEKKAEKEAQRAATLFEEKVRNGMIADDRIKFQDFAERWFSDYAEIHLRARTLARYRELTKRIYPAIGHMYMDKIRPAHLMEFYKTLTETTIDTKYSCIIDLKERLKQIGMTKIACSNAAGVGISVLSSVYQGKNIEKRSAQRIADALGLPFDSLFAQTNTEKKLAGKTILHYHRLISSIMHTAVKWQVIVANPCERVDPPKAPNKGAEYLETHEAIKLLQLIENEPIFYKTAVTVLLFTGMRRGELLGLNWSDIDFDNRTISISRSSLYLPSKGIFIDETKNQSSNRVIKAPATAIKSLRALQKWQLTQKFTLGMYWNSSDIVFTAQDGTPMHPDTLSRWFADFIKKTDLPNIHIHSLRHTNATLNIANGAAITTVAGMLGHANATTTAKIYAHSIKSAQAAAADMMDNLLSPVQTCVNN